jgi:ABC-type multidrug transport system fused ATPase/permease subunit
MNYNSKNKIYFVKNDHSSTHLFKKYGAGRSNAREIWKSATSIAAHQQPTQEDKESLIEKGICLNKRTRILLLIAFFVFFSISNFILQLLYALSPSLWPDSFPLVPIMSLNLGSTVLTFILLVIFTFNGIDQLVQYNHLIFLNLFTIGSFIFLIICDIVSLIIRSYINPFPWVCAVLSLLVFISSCIYGGYYCLKNEKKEEDGH